MTKPKLRKKAEINPPQSPHDGIHTCSKGCNKPGCTRSLRDTIEEQDKQIEALKRDVMEKTAELRKSEEHNEALCERMQDLNSELFAASNINGKLHMNRVHDLNQMGEQCEEIARLKAEVDKLTFRPEHYLNDDGEWVSNIVFYRMQERLKAEVERLAKAGDAMADNCEAMTSSEHDCYDSDLMKFVRAWNAAKEGKQS